MDKITAKKENMLTIGISLLALGVLVLYESAYVKITEGKEIYWSGLIAGIIIWLVGLATLWLRGIFKLKLVSDATVKINGRPVVVVNEKKEKEKDAGGEVEGLASRTGNITTSVDIKLASAMSDCETLTADEMRKRMEVV